jgi:autotransporter-associated beta strand protein
LGQGAVTNHGSLVFNRSDDLAAANNISGTGSLSKQGAGALTLTGTNSYSGGTTVSAGHLIGTTASLQRGITNQGTVEFSQSTDGAYSGVLTGNGSLAKSGAGAVTLSASNSYTGATTVSGGTLIVAQGGSIGSSSSTTVGSGAHLKVNGRAGAVSVSGTLSGSGTVGTMTLNSGAKLAVGNSPGLLTASSATWNAGSTFQFEIVNATGTAGTDWDLFSATGVLDLTSIRSSSKMNLEVLSAGLQNYLVDTEYTWVFAKAASLGGVESWISGLDVTDRFAIDSTGFNGGTPPGRGFRVLTGTDGGFATLSLKAVPEPSSGALLVAGLAALAVMRRRRAS